MEVMQPAQRAPFWIALAVCLSIGFLRTVDLLLFTDPLTGYVTAGPMLARCAVLLLTVLLLRVTANLTSQRPLRNPSFNRALAVVLLFVCLLTFTIRLWQWTGEMPLVEELLTYLAGVGLAFCTWRAATMRRRIPLMLPAVLVMPWLLWTATQRVLLGPASINRLPATLRAASIVAALVFFVALLRMLFVPSQAGNRICFAAGFSCFLLCSCVEWPQALYELVFDTLQPGAMAEAMILSGLGLAGLLCGWHATDPEDEME